MGLTRSIAGLATETAKKITPRENWWVFNTTDAMKADIYVKLPIVPR